MDNKNTNSQAQLEQKGKVQAPKREKIVITTSAIMIMGALTLTGIYMNRVQEKQSPGELMDFYEDWSDELVESPETDLLDDFQAVDSGTVKNPGMTAENDAAEASDGNLNQQDTTRKPASKTSNDLTNDGSVLEELAQTAMSEFVESMTLSFNGLSVPESFLNEDKVLLPYSMDKAVYFQTLDQYKYNPAMIIAAEVGDPVYTFSSGKIVDKYWNHENGWIIEMDLGGGFKAYYGQLNSDTMEKEVDTYVAAGDILGYVDVPTKYYSKEGSNIYFAMTRDGKPVNPMDYLTRE